MNKVEQTKATLYKMMETDYAIFIKALMSIERNVNNEAILNKMYQEFLDEDGMMLLDLSTLELNYGRWVNAYNQYLENQGWEAVEEKDIKTKVAIAYTERLGNQENYHIQIEYDLEKEQLITKVYNEILTATRIECMSLKECTNQFEATFEDWIAQHNTGIDYDKLDTISDFIQKQQYATATTLAQKLGYELDWHTALEEKMDITRSQKI